MKSASWETGTGALLALLNSAAQIFKADLFTITLSGGSVLRYTDTASAVTINGNTYLAGPVIKRSAAKVSIGVTVDTMDLSMSAPTTVTVNGVPLLQFIAGGGLDGARVRVETAYAADASASASGAISWVGSLFVFEGRVAEVSGISRVKADISLASDAELLNVKLPRNIYQPGCLNTLYDLTCGVVKASHTVAANATGATDTPRTTFSITGTHTVNRFALGKITCNTGANAGLSRSVKSNAASAVTVIQPWPSAVQSGDQFTLYAGCDKLRSTCISKFNNLGRFRGFPFVPAPETVT